MLPRISGPACAGTAALLVALIMPAIASALPGEHREISGDQDLGGDYVFDTFTVTATGKLHVPPFVKEGMGGWLTVTANTITILGSGLIEADGAGYAGVDGADGQSPPSTSGGGGKGTMAGLPGGGGAFFAMGANGMTEPVMAGVCVDKGAASPGGTPFFDMMTKAPMLGASGGAANVMPIGATAGGSGGGGIILRAAVVVIDGTVTANGAQRFAVGGVAPGAGSGGTVKIVAALLKGGGTIEARGGDGVHGAGSTNPANPAAPNTGGAGSGGVILLSLPSGGVAPSTLHVSVAGGVNGGCKTSAPDGMVVLDPLPGTCVDFDGDSHNSAQCGGDDCDDTDDKIFPGVAEVCDGKDNDCNKIKDDGDKLCSPGNACVDGACKAVAPDGGTSDGGAGEDAGAPPDHVEFGGGCALPASGGLAEGAVGSALLTLGALALAAGTSRRGGPRAGERPRRRARRP